MSGVRAVMPLLPACRRRAVSLRPRRRRRRSRNCRRSTCLQRRPAWSRQLSRSSLPLFRCRTNREPIFGRVPRRRRSGPPIPAPRGAAEDGPGRNRASPSRRRTAENTAADDAADDTDAARRGSRAARAHPHRTGDERSEPGQLPGVERRRPKSVRHGQAICDPGRGCAARAQSRLRQATWPTKLPRSPHNCWVTDHRIRTAGWRSTSRVSTLQALIPTAIPRRQSMRCVRPSLPTLQRNRSAR